MQLQLPGLHPLRAKTAASHGAPKVGIPDHLREIFAPLPARRCDCIHPQVWKDDDGRLRCGACGRAPR